MQKISSMDKVGAQLGRTERARNAKAQQADEETMPTADSERPRTPPRRADSDQLQRTRKNTNAAPVLAPAGENNKPKNNHLSERVVLRMVSDLAETPDPIAEANVLIAQGKAAAPVSQAASNKNAPRKVQQGVSEQVIDE